MHIAARSVLTLAVVAVAAYGAPRNETGHTTHAWIATAIGDGAATDRPAHARADQHVTLYAVIEIDGVTYSDAPQLVRHRRKLAPTPLPRAQLRWFRIEPTSANLSNGDPATFHFEPITYRATAIATADDHAALLADVHPTLTPDHGHGVGTMRYQLVATVGALTVASPGAEAYRGKGSGGLTDEVARVSIRRDDTYLGYLTEMFNQPYIWASSGRSAITHQAERLEGSDCADFIVYGARRMGAKLAYTWTGGLPGITTKLGAGQRTDDGVYRDPHGKPVPFTQPGDLVLFPRHVGALVEDRGTIGVLDEQDLMMHTLFDSPKTEPIADSGYADKPVEVRRITALGTLATPRLRRARSEK